MEIRNIHSLERGLQALHTVEAKTGTAEKAQTFTKAISSLSDEQRRQHMQALAREIDEQGQKVAKRVDIKEFEKYRRLIREFVDEVVSHGYEFSRENSYASRGRHRYTATIRTIDEKLDALARDVLDEQADGLDILQKMDEIHGLILDMML